MYAKALVTAVLLGASALSVGFTVQPSSAAPRETTAASGLASTWTESVQPLPAAPEDLEAVPGRRLVVASAPAHAGKPGSLMLLDRDGRVVSSYPSSGAGIRSPKVPLPGYRACPSAPDPTVFSPHGIDVVPTPRGARVFAVSHGGRESVEVFDLAEGSDALRWVGCVVLPAGTSGNGVAALSPTSFVMTNFMDPSNPIAGFTAMFAGQNTGDVRTWTRHRGWTTVPDSAAPGPNGILATPDGSTAYVARWTDKEIVRLDLTTGASQVVAHFPFLPDNLRWTRDGHILVTGQDITFQDILVCNAGAGTNCPEGYQVVDVDPRIGATSTIFSTPKSDIMLAVPELAQLSR
jgi:hypothetical protein